MARNVKTHTGMVHAARIDKARRALVPRCMSRTQIGRMHYAIPTDEAVTCGKCRGIMAHTA